MPDEQQPAASYAERQAAIISELNDPVVHPAQTDSAPASFSDPQAPAPKEAPSTEGDAKGTGPQEPSKDERHAGNGEDGDDDAPITLTTKEIQARIADATRRQSQDQSRLARELKEARETAARLKADLEQRHFDAAVLYEAQERVKRSARENGVVGFADVDEATQEAIRNQSRIHDMTRAQQQESERRDAEAQAVVAREGGARTDFGKSLHSDTVVAVMEAAGAAGQSITSAQAREAIKAAYGDKAVKADLSEFLDLQTPPEKARQRAEVAFERIKDLAVRGVTKAAVARINEEREASRPQQHDRRQVHGEVRGSGPSYSRMGYADRRAHVLAELNDDRDIRSRI